MLAPKSEQRANAALLNHMIGGRWRVELRLGAGSFGEVYRASDTTTGETVAIKVFRSADPDSGYLAELGLLDNASHANIVKVLSFGYVRGQKYIVYEFMPGGSLRNVLRVTPRLPADRALRIFRDIMDGLAFAHTAKVVHRDLKPENVLLTADRWPFRASLCDFGLATRCEKSLDAGRAFGSPAYMAPEQFDSHYDHRVDLYAAGVILYEMLLGHRPFDGDFEGLRHAHRSTEPSLPESLPASLRTLMLGLLAKNPDERPSDYGAIRRTVQELLSELAQGQRVLLPTQSDQRKLHFVRRWAWEVDRSLEQMLRSGDSNPRLLMRFADRIVAAEASGASRAEYASPEDTLAVLAGSGARPEQLWVRVPTGVRSLSGAAQAAQGHTHARELGNCWIVPDRELALFVDHQRVTCKSLGDGAILWEAAIESYGALPTLCFHPLTSHIWIAAEAPKCHLFVLRLDGSLVARLPIPTSDTLLEPHPNGAMFVASERRKSVFLVDQQGFAAEAFTAERPISGLCVLGTQHLLAFSRDSIQGFPFDTGARPFLLPRPVSAYPPVIVQDSLFTARASDSSTRIEAWSLAHRS